MRASGLSAWVPEWAGVFRRDRRTQRKSFVKTEVGAMKPQPRDSEIFRSCKREKRLLEVLKKKMSAKTLTLDF